MIVIKLFIPPRSFMLQLAAAAPGLFMPLFLLLLEIILFIIRIIMIIVSTYPEKLRLHQLTRTGSTALKNSARSLRKRQRIQTPS